MKTLYTLRPSDGRVMCYDGKWQEKGFLQGLATPRLDADMAANWFKFQGKLWCAVLTDNSVIVGEVVDGNIKPVATLPTMVEHASWGAAVNYGGQMRWLEQNEVGVVLYSFDGSVIVPQAMLCPKSDLSIASAFANELDLVMLGTHLAMLPRGLATADTKQPQAIVRNTISRFDILDHGATGVESTSLPINDADRQIVVIPTSAEDAEKQLSNAVVGAGVYKERVVALFADGRVGRLDEALMVRTVVADVRKETFMREGPFATTVDGSASRQITIDSKQLAKNILPYILGARVTISGGPLAGRTGTVLWLDGNETLQIAIGSDTPEAFPPLPANTEITFGRGVAGGFTGDPLINSVPGPLVHSYFFEVNDALYGVILGRQPARLQKTAQGQPSFLVRMRGDTAVFTPLRFKDEWINAYSASSCFDPSDNTIHILYYDPAAAAVRHARYSILSGVLWDLGVAYAAPLSGVHLAGCNFIGFDAGELDVVISSITSDAVVGDVLVGYSVYGTQPVNSVLEFAYNTGDGWKPATRSPNPGPDGVFVHALRADLPSYDGEIQYRALVRRP